MSEERKKFINDLPKVELHAHLNGSLSNETLEKLTQLKYGTTAQNLEKYNQFTKLELAEGFEKFKYAHQLTDTIEAVGLATECVIRDFAKDNVIYLELRTTPRVTSTMTKDEYISTVIHTILIAKSTMPNILVKLIISINRRESVTSAQGNIALAVKYHKLYPNIVCGVDLSGDPTAKTFEEFKDVLNIARNNGLQLALHCGEVDNEIEIDEMLKFGMDRLGHGTFVTGKNEELLRQNNKITLECCLTSNLLCGSVASYDDHHFRRFFENGHPVVICTDDFGVFNTTLSNELLIASNTFNLTMSNLVKLNESAVHSSFSTDVEKAELLRKIKLLRKLV